MRLGTLLVVFPLLVSGAIVDTAVLDPDSPLLVEVGSGTPTTLQFPSTITAIIGSDISESDESARFQYSHPEGSNLISIKSTGQAGHAFMMVQMNGGIYVFALQTSSDPTLVLRLTLPPNEGQLEVAEERVLSERLVVNEQKCRQLINFARNPDYFKSHMPKTYEGFQTKDCDYEHRAGSVSTSVKTVYRFPIEDALVFKADIESAYGNILPTANLQIAVGSKRFPVSFVLLGERLELGKRMEVWVVLVGDGGGRRGHISIDNEFRLTPESLRPTQILNSAP